MRSIVAIVFVAYSFSCSIGWAEQTPEQKAALTELRAALAGRQLSDIAARRSALLALKGDAAFQEEAARVDLLAGYVVGFWEAVDKGARAALNSGELNVDGKIIAIVDYDRRLFIIRMDGENKRYTIKDMPPKLALVVSQQHLKKELPNNKVYFGSFLAMDGKGDRKIARQYWDEAARGGVDVKALLPELETPQATAPITLPDLSPQAKTMLQPAQWVLRKKEKGRLTRDTLGKRGKQNEAGRLEVSSAKEDESQVLHKQRFLADFRCIAYFQNLPAGQKFGLYGALLSDDPVTVTLPAGDVKVELQRLKGEFTCKVNDRTVAITAGSEGARLAGNVGVSIPGEGGVVIAGYFFEGR